MDESGPVKKLQKFQEESNPDLFDLFDLYLAFDKRCYEGDPLVRELFSEGYILSGHFLNVGEKVIIETRGKPEETFVFEVTQVDWPDLSVSGTGIPRKVIRGRLRGALISKELETQEVSLVGSGGENFLHRDVIELGSYLCFRGVSEDFMTPSLVRDYGIARQNSSGVWEVLKPKELNIRNRTLEDNQNSHIRQIVSLMKKFGFNDFNFMDCREIDLKNLHNRFKVFDDETFYASFLRGGIDGNEFFIFNKVARQFVVFKYFNFHHQNMLQIAYTDQIDSRGVIPDDYKKFPIGSMYRAGVPIVTFTSSPQLGIDVCSYHPSKGEMDVLTIPKYKNIPIDIQLWPNNEVRVGVERSPFYLTEQESSNMSEATRKMTKTTLSSDGKRILQLGNEKTIAIKSPKDVFSEILK